MDKKLLLIHFWKRECLSNLVISLGNNVVIIIHYDFSSNDIVIIVYYDFHGSRRCCCYRLLKCADNALLDYKHDFFCIERKNKTIEKTSFVSFFGQMVFQT